MLQVIKAVIDRVADLAKKAPSFIDVAADPPGPGLSRLRVIFLFKYGNHAKSTYIRTRHWWMGNLREHYFDMDKECSRAGHPPADERDKCPERPQAGGGEVQVNGLFGSYLEAHEEGGGG